MSRPSPRVPESLPFAVVDDLFHRLGLVYGHTFLGRFSGIDLGAVKEEWRHQLAGVTGQQLDYALSNLPGVAPENAIAFRQLARSMPDERRLAALPAPVGRVEVPEAARQAMQRLAEPRGDDEPPPHIIQARAYIARRKGRYTLSPNEQEWLEHYRNLVARWESQQEAIRQRKAKQEGRHAATQH